MFKNETTPFAQPTKKITPLFDVFHGGVARLDSFG
jgi:hypothetical protein